MSTRIKLLFRTIWWLNCKCLHYRSLYFLMNIFVISNFPYLSAIANLVTIKEPLIPQKVFKFYDLGICLVHVDDATPRAIKIKD